MIDWKRRNRAIEAALHYFLGGVPGNTILCTTEVAREVARLVPYSEEEVTRFLVKFAKWAGPKIATHDGETYARMGRTFTRWNWHGQSPMLDALTDASEAGLPPIAS